MEETLPTTTPEGDMVIADEGAYDTTNHRSLYNLLPPSIQESLLNVKNSFLRDLSETSTAKEIRHMKEYPLVRKVRQAFWREYDNALAAGRKMQMTRIWQGVTAHSGDFYNLMKKEHFAAFIFTKPISKDIQERALLELAYDQIEDILTASHYTPEGHLNAASARVKVEIFKHLEERVNGGILKQVKVTSEQKNLNVNVETTAAGIIEMKRAEELNERLAELREQTKEIESVPAVARLIEEDDDQY